jgi:branched-chain amino acid transport system ATP-binding protein
MSVPLLKVEKLHAGYGGMPVLRDVALEVCEGEIVALVGSNGAGKTTLLRALSGLLPWRGRVTFAGASLQGAAPDRISSRGLVQVPEGRQLFDRMTVQDNLLMGAYRRNDGRAIREDLERVYTQFSRLKERRKQLAGTMSGGEQQICAMARALMARPRLMMVDEMSLGLAPVIVQQLMEVLVKIRTQGMTVLLVEQDVHLALSSADRCYVLETGSVVRSGRASELINDPEVQRAYLGL